MVEILMCTYNGEKFLKEQLDSLRYQTKPADRVSIYDDISSDNTVTIIKDYINEYNLEKKWFLHINQENKGWKKNFYDGILASTGDIVFFCDQDDVWELDKIEIMSKAFAENEYILKLNSYYTIKFEKEIQFVEYEKSNNTCEVKKELFDENFGLYRKNRSGCTTAISGEVRDILKSIPFTESFSHDYFLENIIGSIDRSYIIDYSSIKYRLHGNNATYNTKITMENHIAYAEYVCEVLQNYVVGYQEKCIDIISRHIKLLKLKADIHKRFSLIKWFKLLKFKDLYSENFYKKWLIDLLDMLHLLEWAIKVKHKLKFKKSS